MAVELRCPECRAKLRLPVSPEEGSEIECPKCGHVFPAEGNAAGAARADNDDPRPSKKTSRDDDEPRRKKKDKKPATATKTDEAGEPRKKKKRKLKKRTTNTAVLVGAIIGGLLVLGIFIGAIVWFFTRKSASQEMMMYLPDDCDEVSGINLGHIQKYPSSTSRAKVHSPTRDSRKPPMRSPGARTGNQRYRRLRRPGGSGASAVRRADNSSRPRFSYQDQVRHQSLEQAAGHRRERETASITTRSTTSRNSATEACIFAPTDRIVVFCRTDTPPAKFDAMLDGNKDNAENCAFARSGQLGKQVIRGTAWKFTVFNRSMPKMNTPPSAPAAGGQQGGENDDEVMRREAADILNKAKGSGFKASVGSRDIRGEWIVWYEDSEAASNMLKKWKEKEWIKDEEQEAPRWFKALAARPEGVRPPRPCSATASASVRRGKRSSCARRWRRSKWAFRAWSAR